jgi:hypothetical protein
LGGRTGYLLKSSAASQGSSSRQDVTDFMSLDIGAAFGFEIYLVKRLICYNMSFGNIYEQQPSAPFPFPFTPSDVKGRNAVLQFFAGIRL